MSSGQVRWISSLVIAGTVCAGCGAAGSETTAATDPELAVPAEVIEALEDEAGLKIGAAPSMEVPNDVPEELSEVAQQTGYSGEISADTRIEIYLIDVHDTSANRAAGLTPGPEWLVYYPQLDIEVPGPIRQDGQPAEGSTVERGYVLVDPDTGAVELTHWAGG